MILTAIRRNSRYAASREFDQYRDTRPAVGETSTELVATRELSVNTAPAYVIGCRCQEVVAKKLSVADALQK
jgi:hypothetical protein